MKYIATIFFFVGLLFSPTIASAQVGSNAIGLWNTPQNSNVFQYNQAITFSGEWTIPPDWRGIIDVEANGVVITQLIGTNYGNMSPSTRTFSITPSTLPPNAYAVRLVFRGWEQCVETNTCLGNITSRSFRQPYGTRNITVAAPVTQGFLSVSPDPLYYGGISWGAPPTRRTVTIKNNGGRTLTGSVTSVTDPSVRCVNGCTNYSLTPGQEKYVEFELTPPMSGTRIRATAYFSCGGCVYTTEYLSIQANLYDPLLPVPSFTPVISITPAVIDFDTEPGPTPTPTGQRKTVQVTISNTGGADAYLYRVESTGAPLPDYILPADTWTKVGANSSITRNIIFAPTNGGTFSGTLRFRFGDGSTPWKAGPKVDVSGTGDLVAVYDLRGIDTDFGDVMFPGSDNQTVTVSNVGPTVIGSGTIEFPVGSPFSCISPIDPMDGKCHYDLGANDSEEFLIRFMPAGLGAVPQNLAELTLSGFPTSVIELTGNGVAGGVPSISLINPIGALVGWTVSPQFINFGNQDIANGEKELQFSLVNNGTGPSSVVFSTTVGDPGVFSKPIGSYILPANGVPVEFTLGFDPDVRSAIPQTATVNIVASGYPQPMILNESGIGTESLPEITPSSINFGRVPVAKKKSLQVVIENTGTKDFGSPWLGVAGADQAFYNCVSGCEALPLPPLSSRTIVLEFNPGQARSYSNATLNFFGGINGINSAVIPIQGEGIRTTIKYIEN